MKKTQLFLLFCLIIQTAFGQGIQKTMLKLPDTGQTGDFTPTFGEDSDYNINVPFFIKNNNGTVVDTITGLMWQQTDGGEMTVENARIYADTLTLAGYTDWRLPTGHEAYTILNHQKNNPAIDAAFTTTAAEYWWTVNVQSNDATRIWVTNAGGGIGNHLKTETISAGGTKKIHVRAVRDVKTPTLVASQFTDKGDGTIKDNLTGLTWQKVPNPDTITWENALTYAENLTLGGFSDWRLPNIKELQSISDDKLVNPSVSTTFFPAIGVKKYWSSTSLPNQTTRAWYLSTQFGITTYDLKTVRLAVLCVRGSSSNTTAIQETDNAVAFAKVFPNPNFGQHIQFEMDDNTKDLTVQLIDVQSRVVLNQQFKAFQYEKTLSISPPQYNDSFYWLSLERNGEKMVKKVVMLKN
jgi:hypothetical protein